MAAKDTDRLLSAALAGDELTAQVVSRTGRGYTVRLLRYDTEAFLPEQYIFGMDGVLQEGTILHVVIVAFPYLRGEMRVQVAVGLPLEQQQTMLYRVREEEQKDFDFLEDAVLEEGVWLKFHPQDKDTIARAVRDSQLPPLLEEKRLFWSKVTQIKEQNLVLRGRVLQSVYGKEGGQIGYRVALQRLRAAAFMPGSEVHAPGEPIEVSEGSSVEVRILKFDPSKGSVVVSQRAVLEERLAARLEQLKPYLRTGVSFRGRVTGLQERGAVIDIGGVQGYLPISEMSNQWVENPSQILDEGEIRDFVVRDLSERRGRPRLTFSLKLIATEYAPFGYEEYQIRLLDIDQENDLISSITILDNPADVVETEDEDWDVIIVD